MEAGGGWSCGQISVSEPMKEPAPAKDTPRPRHPKTKFSTQRFICPRVTKVREIGTKPGERIREKGEGYLAPIPRDKGLPLGKEETDVPIGKW